MTYLKKEIKSRPQEKISNVIMNIKNSLIEDKQKGLRTTILILGIITPLIVFSKPRIMYEKVSDGYAVRFYTFGLTNFKTVEIPEKHNGKPVLSLRGNTFSNMPFLEEVNLPNTIKEINTCSYYDLLKIPGIGVKSAKRIINSRKKFTIHLEDLKRMGVVLKRAKYFILCNGKYITNKEYFNKNFIEKNVVLEENRLLPSNTEQLRLF